MIKSKISRKLGRWVFLSGQVAGVQILVQGINAITGLMLVRYLPKQEYAWFTLAGSLLATLNLLADGGISTGLTALGGRLCDQPGPFSRLFHEGLRLSKTLCMIGIVLAFPLFYGLYTNINAPLFVILGIFMLASVGAWPSVSTVLLNVANRLHKRVRTVQEAEVAGALSRLFLTAAVLVSGWLATLPVLAATVAASCLQAVLVRLKTKLFLKDPVEAGTQRHQLLGFVRSLYANHIFFCLQAQIATWLLGWLAGSSEVADLGALARLGVLFTAILAPFSYLVIPAIARIQDQSALRVRFALVLVASVGIAASLVAVAWWQPTPFLWLLGANYQHLIMELPLALCAQGVTMIAGLAWALVLARGWVRQAWVTIFTTLLGFGVGAMTLPLNTVVGMLSFGIVSALPTLLFCLGVIVSNLSRGTPGPSAHNA